MSAMNQARDPLRRTFDLAADLYEAARPSYPEALIEELIDLSGLEAGSRLLEIGCGTGKATRPLLDRGFSVVCVEMGAQLAQKARANLAGLPVEVHVAEFETWAEILASFGALQPFLHLCVGALSGDLHLFAGGLIAHDIRCRPRCCSLPNFSVELFVGFLSSAF